jgi:hypothetical protein
VCGRPGQISYRYLHFHSRCFLRIDRIEEQAARPSQGLRLKHHTNPV